MIPRYRSGAGQSNDVLCDRISFACPGYAHKEIDQRSARPRVLVLSPGQSLPTDDLGQRITRMVQLSGRCDDRLQAFRPAAGHCTTRLPVLVHKLCCAGIAHWPSCLRHRRQMILESSCLIVVTPVEHETADGHGVGVRPAAVPGSGEVPKVRPIRLPKTVQGSLHAVAVGVEQERRRVSGHVPRTNFLSHHGVQLREQLHHRPIVLAANAKHDKEHTTSGVFDHRLEGRHLRVCGRPKLQVADVVTFKASSDQPPAGRRAGAERGWQFCNRPADPLASSKGSQASLRKHYVMATFAEDQDRLHH